MAQLISENTNKKSKKPLSVFKKKLIIYISINLIVILIFCIFYYQYSKIIISEVSAVTDKKKSQADVNLLADYISRLEKDYKQVLEEFGPYLDLLPAKDDLLDFKDSVVSIAKKYKLDPAFSFGVENSATEKEPKSYGFTLIISGTTANLLSFWSDFAKLKYIVRIEQILIDYEDVQSRTSSESLGSGNVSVSTTIKPMSLGEELMAKRKSTTTTKKKTTTTTKITDRYKMNILGKVYIK